MNNLSSQNWLTALLLCATCLIGACTKRLNEQAGIEGTGDTMTSSGVVTKLGSIYVNGVHFNTDNAEVYIDGELTSSEALAQGMVVEVEGTAGESAGDAIANKVNFNYLVTGAINSIQVDSNNMLYLSLPGYEVIVPENTIFSGTDYDNLSVDDIIAVSGLEMDSSTIYASQIKSAGEADYTSLLGQVTELNTNNRTFLINDVIIAYGQAEMLSTTTLNNLQAGELIQVRGYLARDENVLSAQTLTKVKRPAYDNRVTVAQEGFIADYASIQSFRVNGVLIDASNAEFFGGEASQLHNRLRVSVKGVFKDNFLYAQEVRMILPSNFKTTGRIDSVDLAQKTFRVADFEFKIEWFTVFDDAETFSNRYFNLADLRIGDQVEIYARQMGFSWMATTVRRQPISEEPFSIRGKITGFDRHGNIYLYDLLVDISAIPLEKRWPYKLGNDIFVMGAMDGYGVLLAKEIFPAIIGCSRWNDDDCRPIPEPHPPNYWGIDWLPPLPGFEQDTDPKRLLAEPKTLP